MLDAKYSAAVNKLSILGIISAPEYWEKAIEKDDPKYLGDLFLKVSEKVSVNGNATATVDQALANLVKAGIISAPSYWKDHADDVAWLSDCIRKFGGCFPNATDVTITKSPQERLLDTARAEVGYLEKASNSQLDSKTANAGYNNWTKFARDLDNIGLYNGKKNGYAWCDMFCDWCFVQTFGLDLALKMTGQVKGGLGAGCKYSAQYYEKIGQFFRTNPKSGDQIFFSDGAGGVPHTGLVEKVDSAYIYTIEGNTSSAAGVVANGGSVNKKKYAINFKKLYGFGRPLYNLAG